jgi:hypothetical protein
MNIRKETIETVYINRGYIYKASADSVGTIEGKNVKSTTLSREGVESNYYAEPVVMAADMASIDRLIPVKSRKIDSEGNMWEKTYKSSKNYLRLLELDPTTGVDIGSFGVDLCPDVDIWANSGIIDSVPTTEFLELYFNVSSEENMQIVSEFYGLENPLPMDNDLNTNRENWTVRSYPDFSVDLVLGSVVFKNSIPTLLKIYKFETQEVEVE